MNAITTFAQQIPNSATNVPSERIKTFFGMPLKVRRMAPLADDSERHRRISIRRETQSLALIERLAAYNIVKCDVGETTRKETSRHSVPPRRTVLHSVSGHPVLPLVGKDVQPPVKFGYCWDQGNNKWPNRIMTECCLHGLIRGQDARSRNAETPAVSDGVPSTTSRLQDEVMQIMNHIIDKLRLNTRGPELRTLRDSRHRPWVAAERIELESRIFTDRFDDYVSPASVHHIDYRQMTANSQEEALTRSHRLFALSNLYCPFLC
jgi:hypothetical protein